MKVILISGKAQHGKDTTAGFLKEALEKQGQRVLICHYGDLVKYICKSFFGWNGKKDEAGRSLLQRVGTDVIRAQCEDYWVRFILEVLGFFPAEWDYVLVPDCRFPNEVHLPRFVSFNALHVRVVRPNFDNGLTEEQKNHPSETALDNVKPDYVFHNNSSLTALRDAVVMFTKAVLLNHAGEEGDPGVCPHCGQVEGLAPAHGEWKCSICGWEEG